VGHLSASIFTAHSAPDSPAELFCNQLRAVADTQDGDTKFVDRGIQQWRTVHVHALGATGQDDRCRSFSEDLGCGNSGGNDLGEDLKFSDPTGDQLGVLGSKVHY
jgi:hypothetical protein